MFASQQNSFQLIFQETPSSPESADRYVRSALTAHRDADLAYLKAERALCSAVSPMAKELAQLSGELWRAGRAADVSPWQGLACVRAEHVIADPVGILGAIADVAVKLGGSREMLEGGPFVELYECAVDSVQVSHMKLANFSAAIASKGKAALQLVDVFSTCAEYGNRELIQLNAQKVAPYATKMAFVTLSALVPTVASGDLERLDLAVSELVAQCGFDASLSREGLAPVIGIEC